MKVVKLAQQESLFSVLPATDQMFEVGDAVFEVVLGEVRPMIVTGTFDYEDHREAFGAKTVRYHAEHLNGGGNTFGKRDVGKFIFVTEQEARAQATMNLADADVHTILMNPAEADEWEAYREDRATFGRKHKLYACCARFGNMVYHSSWCTYHFMEEYADEKAAKRAYRKETKGMVNDFSGKPHKCSPAPLETRLLYGRDDGKWAECDYAFNQWYDGYYKRWIEGNYDIA